MFKLKFEPIEKNKRGVARYVAFLAVIIVFAVVGGLTFSSAGKSYASALTKKTGYERELSNSIAPKAYMQSFALDFIDSDGYADYEDKFRAFETKAKQNDVYLGSSFYNYSFSSDRGVVTGFSSVESSAAAEIIDGGTIESYSGELCPCLIANQDGLNIGDKFDLKIYAQSQNADKAARQSVVLRCEVVGLLNYKPFNPSMSGDEMFFGDGGGILIKDLAEKLNAANPDAEMMVAPYRKSVIFFDGDKNTVSENNPVKGLIETAKEFGEITFSANYANNEYAKLNRLSFSRINELNFKLQKLYSAVIAAGILCGLLAVLFSFIAKDWIEGVAALLFSLVAFLLALFTGIPSLPVGAITFGVSEIIAAVIFAGKFYSGNRTKFLRTESSDKTEE